MNVVYTKREYILPFKKYLNKPKKTVSFEQKVDYEYTYGKNDYDRKPIENVEQITLRELYELTLSRIEARKSNVYYSNQAPNEGNSDFIDYFNGETISEQKINMIGKIEQEKIKNIDVDELENKNKSIKKIKLDFNKAQTTMENKESDENESLINNTENSNDQHNGDSESNQEHSQTHYNDIENKSTESVTEDNATFQKPLIETSSNSLTNSPKQPMDHDQNEINSSPKNVYHPNGNVNKLPNKIISPKRLDSKHRRGSGSGINSPLDLVHYRPPLKSLEEINDPNYEKHVGHVPIPYGSNVVYEEPDITSPNLENAIPNYPRPQMNHRDNIISMSQYGQDNEKKKEKKKDKKKEKKKDRKSLSFLHILKKSKSAENVKGKTKTSLFKSNTKTENITYENKRNTSPPSLNTFNLNDSVDTNKNQIGRTSINKIYEEPTNNDLVIDGPTIFNNENKPLSKYAIKTLKLRDMDNHLHQISNNLSNNTHNVQKPNLNTYVPNIPLD